MPGLPNTRVIPPGWEQHHRPVTANAMTATCVITRPPSTSAGVWDNASGRTVYPTPQQVYPADGSEAGGPCRITRKQAQPLLAGTGERNVTVAGYILALPADAPSAKVNDLVRVVACDGDPTLVGQDLVIRNAARGALTWQRDYDCDLYPATAR